jgi:hypothetical protein
MLASLHHYTPDRSIAIGAHESVAIEAITVARSATHFISDGYPGRKGTHGQNEARAYRGRTADGGVRNDQVEWDPASVESKRVG